MMWKLVLRSASRVSKNSKIDYLNLKKGNMEGYNE